MGLAIFAMSMICAKVVFYFLFEQFLLYLLISRYKKLKQCENLYFFKSKMQCNALAGKQRRLVDVAKHLVVRKQIEIIWLFISIKTKNRKPTLL